MTRDCNAIARCSVAKGFTDATNQMKVSSDCFAQAMQGVDCASVRSLDQQHMDACNAAIDSESCDQVIDSTGQPAPVPMICNDVFR
jgi:hypothetical protein